MFSGKKYCTQKLKNMLKKISLKNLYMITEPLIKSPIKKVFLAWNRGASCITFQKASLTVEAAMILPVFLFFFLGMVYIMSAISIESTVKTSLFETGKELAKYAYLTQIEEGDSEKMERLFGAGSYVYAKYSFLKQEGAEYWDNSLVKKGSNGFFFGQSVFLEEDGIIDLVVRYELKIPFLFVGEVSFPQVQRCRMRGWIGATGVGLESAEEMVYITESGTVYHRSLKCQHLKVTIRIVLPVNLPGERNDNGGKYYPCEFCGNKQLKEGVYYITEDGDRFHTTKQCGGLKRNILTVPLSDVDGRGPCKRCGGMDE